MRGVIVKEYGRSQATIKDESCLPNDLSLSTQQKKTASALAWNVKHFADKHTIQCVGFLTLTFANDVQSSKEAQRRWNSLRSNILANHYHAHIRVLERQQSGRIHYHVLLAMPFDIRSGVDFEAFSRGDYRTASAVLREEWRFWRQIALNYGFGRTELLPIRSTSEGIAKYVGKYISKHVAARLPQDKGVRLVEYSRGARMASTRFSWNTPGAFSWRRKLRLFAQIIGERRQTAPLPFSSFSTVLGPRWSYFYRDFILSLPD